MYYIEENIINTYGNIALIALMEGYNLADMIRKADREIEAHKIECKGKFVPKGYYGLYYVDLLAHKMNRTLGDVYNLSQNIKKEVLKEVIYSYHGYKSYAYDNDFEYDEDGVRFSGFVEVNSIKDLGEYRRPTMCCMGNYYCEPVDKDWADGLSHKENHIFYLLIFEKNFDEYLKRHTYSIYISGTEYFKSDHIYDDFLIWKENEGKLADFIEDCISDYYESN